MNPSQKTYAVLYLTWGEAEVQAVLRSIASLHLLDADIYWITDITPTILPNHVTLIHADFINLPGNLKKPPSENTSPQHTTPTST